EKSRPAIVLPEAFKSPARKSDGPRRLPEPEEAPALPRQDDHGNASALFAEAALAMAGKQDRPWDEDTLSPMPGLVAGAQTSRERDAGSPAGATPEGGEQAAPWPSQGFANTPAQGFDTSEKPAADSILGQLRRVRAMPILW